MLSNTSLFLLLEYEILFSALKFTRLLDKQLAKETEVDVALATEIGLVDKQLECKNTNLRLSSVSTLDDGGYTVHYYLDTSDHEEVLYPVKEFLK